MKNDYKYRMLICWHFHCFSQHINCVYKVLEALKGVVTLWKLSTGDHSHIWSDQKNGFQTCFTPHVIFGLNLNKQWENINLPTLNVNKEKQKKSGFGA